MSGLTKSAQVRRNVTLLVMLSYSSDLSADLYSIDFWLFWFGVGFHQFHQVSANSPTFGNTSHERVHQQNNQHLHSKQLPLHSMQCCESRLQKLWPRKLAKLDWHLDVPHSPGLKIFRLLQSWLHQINSNYILPSQLGQLGHLWTSHLSI